MKEIFKGTKHLTVVTTTKILEEGSYPEGKCCSFDGYLEEYPNIEVDVIIGWKDPDTWKPIYKKHKSLPIGSKVIVCQDSFRKWEYVHNYLKMNTNTIEVLKER